MLLKLSIATIEKGWSTKRYSPNSIWKKLKLKLGQTQKWLTLLEYNCDVTHCITRWN